MEKHAMAHGESSPKEYLKLGMVLTIILLMSLWLNVSFGAGGWQEFMRWFMGVFFVVFASFKLIGYRMFAMMFAGYDIVAKRFKQYAYSYPFIELALGIMYLFNIQPVARNAATAIIMGIGVIGVAQELKKRSGIHCACLGNVIKLPLSTVSFIEDAGMGLMAVIMLLMG
jgi:hypothetical protein